MERALLALLLVVLAPVECGAGPWWGGHRGTRGYGAAGLAGGGGGPNVRPPHITTARAPQRARLRRDDADDPRARLRQVRRPARALRGRERRSRGPRRVGVSRRGHLRHARASEAGHDAGDRQQRRRVVERAAAGVRRGLGHRADVRVRRLAAGVPGVRRARGFQAALSPWERARETWESDVDSGPDSRGHATNCAHIVRERWAAPEPRAVCTPSSNIGTTSGHRYWVPSGGPGLGGKVFDVDPTSPGNGPPVTGTFYPSKRLACMFTCPLTVTNASDSPSNSSNVTSGSNSSSSSGSHVDRPAYHASLRRAEEGFAVDASSFTGIGKNVSSLALTRGVASDAATVSVKTAARWIDYTRIACVSPPRPTPSVGAGCEPPGCEPTRTLGDGSVVSVDASRSCVVTVSNDGDVFDDYYANGGPIGGSRDANAPVMPNAAAVTFTYVGDAPTVTSISSRHGVRPEALAALGLPPAIARGPFAGGTTLTVRGDGFLPGTNLRCRFEDDVTGLPPFVSDATWVDDHTVTCSTPTRSPRATTRTTDRADPYPGDGTDPRASLEVTYDANAMNDTIAPCFVANVTVSNDGVAFSDGSSDGAKFLYCDVYAAAIGTTADPTYPYVTDPSTLAGTPNAPFTDLQSALHAALRGARADVADGTDRGSRSRGREVRSRGLLVGWTKTSSVLPRACTAARATSSSRSTRSSWTLSRGTSTTGRTSNAVATAASGPTRRWIAARRVWVAGTNSLGGRFDCSRRSACRLGERLPSSPTAPARSRATARWRFGACHWRGASTTRGRGSRLRMGARRVRLSRGESRGDVRGRALRGARAAGSRVRRVRDEPGRVGDVGVRGRGREVLQRGGVVRLRGVTAGAKALFTSYEGRLEN